VSEQLLAVLRLCLLGLIYLFFLRVLRAVWVEVNGPRRSRAAVPVPAPAPVSSVVAAPAAAAAGSAPTITGNRPTASMRVLEPPALAGRTYPLSDELTIGRAPGCHIQLDDTYVSQLHARVYRGTTGFAVEDLNSTNGTYVNREKVVGSVPVAPGDRVQVGNVVLELV
jgi:FHA domain